MEEGYEEGTGEGGTGGREARQSGARKMRRRGHCNPLYSASQGVRIQGGPLERVQIFSLVDRGPPPQKND